MNILQSLFFDFHCLVFAAVAVNLSKSDSPQSKIIQTTCFFYMQCTCTSSAAGLTGSFELRAAARSLSKIRTLQKRRCHRSSSIGIINHSSRKLNRRVSEQSVDLIRNVVASSRSRAGGSGSSRIINSAITARNYASMTRSPTTSSGPHTAETAHNDSYTLPRGSIPRPSSAARLPRQAALLQILKDLTSLLERATAVTSAKRCRHIAFPIHVGGTEEEQAWLERLHNTVDALSTDSRRKTRIAGQFVQNSSRIRRSQAKSLIDVCSAR